MSRRRIRVGSLFCMKCIEAVSNEALFLSIFKTELGIGRAKARQSEGVDRYARNNQALVLGVHKAQLQSMANAARAMNWHDVRHLALMGDV